MNIRGINVNDYRKLAKLARKELKRHPRQAVEKAYLAAVHMARHLVAASGEPWHKRTMSAAAIGRAAELVGKNLPRDERTRDVTRALSLALGQHSACFYEGLCQDSIVRDAVLSVERASRQVPALASALDRVMHQ